MELLGHIELELLIRWACLLWLAFLALALLILSVRLFFSARLLRHAKIARKFENELMGFIENGSTSGLENVIPSRGVRNYLVSMASQISGSAQTQILRLYIHWGFAVSDAKLLKSFFLHQRMEALYRCRTVGVPLPDEAWELLLKDHNLVFRWTAMEYLIHQKTNNALPWLIRFMHEKPNQRHGVLLHLCSTLAKVFPEFLADFLKTSDNDFIREIIIKTIAAYPNSKCESALIECTKLTDSEEILIAATKALGAMPGTRALSFFSQVFNHGSWVVRLMVARALRNYFWDEAKSMLDDLVCDINYQVRFQAIQTVQSFGDHAVPVIRLILADADHPSRDICEPAWLNAQLAEGL